MNTRITPVISRSSLFLLGLWGVVIPASFFLTSCTSQKKQEASETQGANPLLPGQEKRVMPLEFQPTQTVELELQRRNLETGDSWRASFIKENPTETTLPIIQWRIQNAPDQYSLTDRRADSGWIQHFLDLVQTIERKGPAAAGTLSAFGLDRPRTVIRLKTEQKEHWLSIGDAITEHQFYIRHTLSAPTPSDSEAVVQDVSIAEGAAFEMLRRAPEFEALRQRKISTLDTDDIDVIKFTKAGREIFAAQRLSEGWGNAKNEPTTLPVTEWLEQLTHLRATRFSDEIPTGSPTSWSKSELQALTSSPRYSLELTDRKDRITRFTLHPVQGRVLAKWSDRENVVFELGAETLSILETFPPRGK